MRPAIVRIPLASLAHGEDTLALVWRVLEEHAIPSPKLHVASDGTRPVAVTLSFCGRREAELVLAAIHRDLPASAAAASCPEQPLVNP